MDFIMFNKSDNQNFEIDFEGISNNFFPIIKFGDIVLKTVLRRDSEIEKLILSSYKELNQQIKESLDGDFNLQMISIAMYEKGILVATLSAKKIRESNLMNLLSKSEQSKSLITIFSSLTLGYKDILEITRFASSSKKSLVLIKNFSLFLAYFIFVINTTIEKKKEYVLFSNCSNSHANFYRRLIEKEKLLIFEPFVFNGLECNFIIYQNIISSKFISANYSLIIEKYKFAIEKQYQNVA